MKTVFSNNQLCHVFAGQTQSEGRNSSGSLYFKGNKIWSYGSHHLLGKIFNDQCRGYFRGRTILINSLSYSQTTAQQRSRLAWATRHYISFYLPKPHNETQEEKEENLDYLSNQVAENFGTALNCLSGVTFKIKYLERSIKAHNLFIDIFDIKAKKIEVDEEFLKELKKDKIAGEKIREAKKSEARLWALKEKEEEEEEERRENLKKRVFAPLVNFINKEEV